MTDRKALGKSHRKGITLLELFEMFPDEATARKWFESIIWKDGVAVCHRCGGTNTYEVANGKPLPHKCRTCRKHFSARHGTILEGSHISLRQWAIAVYLVATSRKGVSSMKLHRDLGISQPSAWRMLHKIRPALADGSDVYTGTVEVDETYVGGIERNKHESNKFKAGRGAVGKTAVVGMKQRQTRRIKATVIEDTKRSTLHGFICEGAAPGSTVHSDDFISYQELDDSSITMSNIQAKNMLMAGCIERLNSGAEQMKQAVDSKLKPRERAISEEDHRRAQRIAQRLMSTPRINNCDIKAKKTSG